MDEEFEDYREKMTFSKSCSQDYKDGCMDGAELAWWHQQAKLDEKDRKFDALRESDEKGKRFLQDMLRLPPDMEKILHGNLWELYDETRKAVNLETEFPGNANSVGGGWIDADKVSPTLLSGKDYSENVWAWDGKKILVSSWCVDPNEGWFWANAYGNVFGEAEFDDDYDIKFWQPISIPLPPNEELSDKFNQADSNTSGKT